MSTKDSKYHIPTVCMHAMFINVCFIMLYVTCIKNVEKIPI